MSKHVSNTSSMELSHYATILRRRWVYVASALGVGVLLATALMFVVPSKSTATTSVKINVVSSNAFSAARPPSDLLDMETEQAMARSTSVMNEVASGLGDGWTKSSVRAATEATLLPEGTVLRIQFTGGSPQEAADGATLVAEKYLEYRSDEAQGLVDSASERLVVRRDSLRKQLASANADVSDAPAGSPARLTAELSRQTVADELTTVTTQLNELRVVTTGGGSVLTEADSRQTQSSPNRPLMLFSGVLGGLLSGLVLAFVVNVLDRRVRDAYDVAGAGGGMTVVRLAGDETCVPAVGVEAEQIRAVRERVLAATSKERPVVAVIDVGPQEAVPTDVAINLAASLADSGLETDLVIVDHPVDVLVNVLHDLSAREVGGRDHVRRFRSRTVPTLQISVPDTSGTRLATIDVVVDLVSTLERSAAVTVVAISPSAGSAARLAAGRFADQVLFAVHEMSTDIDELAAVAGELMAVDASALGTVLLPEGRHLTAHPSVGAGALLLRSSVPSGVSASAFTGGAVSGARSSALLEVMEDLVARADDDDLVADGAPDDDGAPVDDGAPMISGDQDGSGDPARVAGPDLWFSNGFTPQAEAESEGGLEPASAVIESAAELEPEAELDSAAEAQSATESETELELATAAESVVEPDVEPEVDLQAEPRIETVDEAVPAPDTADGDEDDTAETVDTAPVAEIPEAAEATETHEATGTGSTVIAGLTKKKRGRGRGPVQSRRTSAPHTDKPSDPRTARPLEPGQSHGSQSGDGSAPQEQPAADQPDADQPDTEQPDTDQPDTDQPDADQPPVSDASAPAAETGDEGRPGIPANENSWAFTR